jgi:hypothetical protein
MVTRLENWPRLLAEELGRAANQPFIWGEHDCALFVAKVVHAVTGNGLPYLYAGTYRDFAGAAEVIAKGGGLYGIFCQHLGQPHTNYRQAGRGDAVLMRLGRLTAGVVDATGEAIASVGPEGMVRLPLNKASFIWSY